VTPEHQQVVVLTEIGDRADAVLATRIVPWVSYRRCSM